MNVEITRSNKMSEKVGIEGLEKCIDLGVKNYLFGKKVSEGGVNWDDLAHAQEAIANIKELVEFVQSNPGLVQEIKDVDPMEGFALIQKAYSAYNTIKA
jgi:hypothetical protein